MAKESRKGALAAVCSSLVVACSQQAAAPRPLTEPVWHLEIDNALVIGEPGAAAQTYLADKDLGLADDDEFEVISQTEDPGGGLVHVRLQQLHLGVPVLGSQIAVHADATTFVGYGGTVTRGLDGFDVTPAIDVDGAAAIATRHLEDALGDSGLSSQVATSRLAIRPRDDDDAELDWQIELDVAPAPGRLPGDWFILVDAVTGEVHEAYDGLNTVGDLTVEQASGPGGNAKLSRSWGGQLDVVRRWGQDHPDGEYQMFTPELFTNDAHGTTTEMTLVAAATLDGFSDPAANDAHAFAEVTLAMMRQWMGRQTIDDSDSVFMRSQVHYDKNFAGAFYGGGRRNSVSYGDGGDEYYPMSGSLDVVAHEFHHQFTAAHSNLVYQRQSGAMNESFSDVGGTVTEFFYEGEAADFLLAEDVSKKKEALRWMCDPTRDGNSIDHTSRYVPDHRVDKYTVWGTDVHYASGIGNRAFCLAVGREAARGSTLVDAVRSMGQVWYQANLAFWTSEATFTQACQGTVDAARSLGRDSQTITAIQQSWADVGAYCESGEGLACRRDGVCDAAAGETCFSCAADCGSCIAGCSAWTRAKCAIGIGDCLQCDDGGVCGDGICGGSETDASCGQDCGCRAPSQSCGSVAPYGCWCDASCGERGDCCADADVCR